MVNGRVSLRNYIYKAEKPRYILCTGLMIVYYYTLKYVYEQFVTIRWSYSGFLNNEVNLYIEITCIVLITLLSVILVSLSKVHRPSSVVVNLMIVITIIPGLIVVPRVDLSFFPIFIAYWAFFFVYYLIYIYNIKINKLQTFSITSFYNILAVIIFIFIFYIWGRYSHFHLQLDLFDVYEQREAAANFGMPAVFSYILGSILVCMPFLIVYGYKNEHKLAASILVIAQIIAFFTQGSKSTIFSLFVSLSLYFLVSRTGNLKESTIITSLIILALFAIIDERLLGSRIVVDSIYRRNLFLPNLLNDYYYSFFKQNPPDLFSSTVLKVFGVYSPYSTIKIQNIIGEIYFNSPNMHCNNGLISDAVMNLGTIGIGVMPLFIIAYFFFLDSCGVDIEYDLIVCSCPGLTFSIIGSSLTTSLFSHGLIMLAILYSCVDGDIDKRQRIVIS